MFKGLVAASAAAVMLLGTAAFGADKVSAQVDLTTVNAEAANASSNAVKKRTKEQIEDYIDKHPYYIRVNNDGYAVGDTYAETPVVKSGSYKPGKLDSASLNSALNALNVCRYVAGLDEVKLNDTYNEYCQAAALVNAANNKMCHSPSKPKGMSDELYELGATGARSSNLAMGYVTLANAALIGWMGDSDPSNIDRVGHRRWCLNPVMEETGFGRVDYYMAMYAFDNSRSYSSDYTVMWPAQVMPNYLFSTDDAWSVSKNDGFSSNTKVTVTRKRDSKKWVFSTGSADGDFYISNAFYGQYGCVIFRPKDIDSYGTDSFSVKITDGSYSFSYNVQFYCDHPYTTSVTRQPTCSKKGVRHYVCPICGDSYDEAIPTTAHKYTAKDVPSTVTQRGYTLHTCSVCGDSYKDNYKPLLKNISNCTASIPYSSYTYRGRGIKPTVTVKDGTKTLTKGTDYTVSYQNNTNVGTATITVTGKGKYGGTLKKTFKVKPLSLSGSYAKVTIPYSSYTYSGKAIKPAVTVRFKDGDVIPTSQYTVSYANNIKLGTATITVKAKGSNTADSYKKTFVVKPAKNEITSITSTKGAFKIAWKKATAGSTGYQVQYSTDKNFVKNVHSYTSTNLSDLSENFSKVPNSGETWYVKVRSFITKDGKASSTRYGNYSAVKSIKVK